MEDSNNSVVEPQFGGSTIEETVMPEVSAVEGTNEVVEEQTVEQPVVNAQEEKFAAKFAALSRKEKTIRQRELQLQQQQQELENRIKALEAQQNEVQSVRSIPERLKKEPLKVLEESGLSFEQLAQMVINDGKPTQEMVLNEYENKIMSKMQELEQKLAEKEAKEQEAKYEAAIQQFQGQLSDFITQNPDYELIRANDSADLVFNVIEEHYTETGEILSNKEACDAVEEYLLEEAKKLVDREKVKKLLSLQPQVKSATSGKSSPTLSNAHAAQASKNVAAKRLSDDESKAEAAKLIRWND